MTIDHSTSNKVRIVTSSKPLGNIRFLSNNLPALDDGFYQLTVSHSFQAISTQEAPSIPDQTRYFAVLGPRFTLDPKEISTQFPQPKTSGAYFDILPHIMFNRAVLPWERRFQDGDANTPWLTLVSCAQTEIAAWQLSTKNPSLLTVCTKTLADACADAKTNGIVFPDYASQPMVPGETSDELINYIDIPEALLQLILPKQDELPLLANVRQSADGDNYGLDNPKFPVLMSNRLPLPGQENTVFVLSMESRTDVYTQLALAPALTGIPLPIAAPKLYRFAVLNYWSFASVDCGLTFTQLLTDADQLDNVTTGVFRLPEVNNPDADPFLQKGFVPLTHQTRQGNNMVSWYRGPFLPGGADPTITPPNPSVITSPDYLVRVYSGIGMFDVSYAGAWNIGRNLALENRRVSQALFGWKRACVQALKANVPAYLPTRAPVVPPLPDVVADWFTRLGRLEQVPFNYLVPDPRLLPEESIQFFSVDPYWVQILLRGAFAIGDIASADEDIEDTLFSNIPIPVSLTGFLLRSAVVSGWPHLIVDGFDAEPPAGTNAPYETGDTPLTQYRYMLGKQTLLCLFEGDIKSVEIYLHPETIHYGVDRSPKDTNEGILNDCYIKYLRDVNGDLPPPSPPNTGPLPCTTLVGTDYVVGEWVRIPFTIANSGVIDINTLSARLLLAVVPTPTSMPSSEFAYQMVEGVPKVRFTMKT